MTLLSTIPRRIAAVIAILAVTAILTELLLILFFPLHRITIGRLDPPKASLYGWAFHPNDVLRVVNPDTGEVRLEKVNAEGWRDRDRSLTRRPGSFRIVVIGDSVTFGAGVPFDYIFSQRLESMLREMGFDAEVINIASSGWSPDQELLALKHEALAYQPDLVILQFTSNDLEEIGRSPGKPLYYDLDSAGELRLVRNESWEPREPGLRRLIRRSQLLSRLAVIYRSIGGAPGYTITENKLDHLRVALGRDGSRYAAALESRLSEKLSRRALLKQLDIDQDSTSFDSVERILRDKWFDGDWSPDTYNYSRHQDPGSPEWQLYFRILDEFQRSVEQTGADLILFCQDDAGEYEWLRKWHHIREGDVVRKKWDRVCEILSEYANARGIQFVKHRRPYARWDNDPHPNVAGHESIAEDIRDSIVLFSNDR